MTKENKKEGETVSGTERIYNFYDCKKTVSCTPTSRLLVQPTQAKTKFCSDHIKSETSVLC